MAQRGREHAPSLPRVQVYTRHAQCFAALWPQRAPCLQAFEFAPLVATINHMIFLPIKLLHYEKLHFNEKKLGPVTNRIPPPPPSMPQPKVQCPPQGDVNHRVEPSFLSLVSTSFTVSVPALEAHPFHRSCPLSGLCFQGSGCVSGDAQLWCMQTPMH